MSLVVRDETGGALADQRIGQSTRRQRGGIVAVLSTAAVATTLVVRHLGTKPLWLDESVSVSVARRPLGRVLSVLPHHDANAGIYYLLLHAWLHLGHSVAWVRGLSSLSFVATAGLAAWVGTRWKGVWLGFAGGLLVSTNRFLLFYGQEARPYALAVLLAVASTAALFGRGGRDRHTPASLSAARWYIAATIALLYVDLFAVLFVAAQAAAILAIHRRRRRPVPPALVKSWAIIAAATAPLALLMMTSQRSQISWLSRPTLRYLEQTVTGMANGWVGLGVMAGLAIMAWASMRAARHAGRANRDQLVVPALLAAFGLPPLLLWVIAQVVPSFIDRYVICSTVALIGLAAFGLAVVRKHLGLVVGVIILTVLAAAGLSSILALERQPYQYENPPAVVAFIQNHAGSGDAIGFAGGGLRTVIDAYVPRDRAFPFDVALAPGGEASRQADVYGREVSSSTLASRLRLVRRLWLVTDPTNHRYPPYGPFAPLRPAITQTFEPTTVGSFPGIDVTLYTRRTAIQGIP